MVEAKEPADLQIPATLGGRIRYAREAATLSQDELAAALGNTQGTISAWETDARTPHPSNLISVARAIGCDTEWLRTGKGPPPVRHTDRGRAFEAFAQDAVDRKFGSPFELKWPHELDDPELEDLFDRAGIPTWVKGLAAGPLSPLDARIVVYALVSSAIQTRLKAGAQIKPSWIAFRNALVHGIPPEFR